MLSLTNKRILLGITGGIAAYKCAELCRLLVTAGAEVRVAMTQAATQFVTPLTLQALSGNRVHLDLLDAEAEAGMGHIELARWADLILVAPATANFLATMVQGRAEDLLSTVILATPATVVVAPSMNQGMWRHAGTADNINSLKSRGVVVLEPDAGEQACGDVGPGRLQEPAKILSACAALFSPGLLAGKRLLITGGPTREALDPVRFLSNHSSGKMAYALAEAAVEAGAAVTLVSGPVSLPDVERAERVDVISAQDMYEAVMERIDEADVFIGVAAVADYRPEQVADMKIKKTGEVMELRLVPNPDIIAEVARRRPRPLVVGFAAETENLADNGRLKLERKGLDLLFANDATATFNSDSVAVTVIDASGSRELTAGSKSAIARQMLQQIAGQLAQADSVPRKSGA